MPDATEAPVPAKRRGRPRIAWTPEERAAFYALVPTRKPTTSSELDSAKRKEISALGGEARGAHYALTSCDSYKAVVMKIAGCSKQEIQKECGIGWKQLQEFFKDENVKEAVDYGYKAGVLVIEAALRVIQHKIEKGDAELALDFYKFIIGRRRAGDELPQQVINIGWPTPPWARPTSPAQDKPHELVQTSDDDSSAT